MEIQEFTTGECSSGEPNNANIITNAANDNVILRTMIEDIMMRFEITEQETMDIIVRMIWI